MRLKQSNRKWLLQLVALSVFVALAASPILGQGTPKPSAIMDQYRAQRITWTTNIWPYANTLFGILATIEFAWSAAVMLLEKHDLQSWTSALVRKMMWIGAFYALLLNGRSWIPAIIDSFEKIGQTASGFNQIAPSDVFAQGIDIAGALMATSSTSAFFENLGTSLAMVVAAAIVALAFTGITVQFIVAMVESYIIVAAGFIFLGFGGSRWTVPYTERYIGLAVSIGLKIMLLYLLIGTGMSLSVSWMTDAQNVSTAVNPAMSAFEIMGASLIFLMLCWQIPKLFSAVLGGAPALSGGDLISTGTGLVAGAATVASLGAGTVAIAARGASAIAGVSAAANAGAGSGAGAVSASTARTGFGGASGGGSVPPPSSPGPSSNGSSPRQPDPPNRGGSGGASADLATVGSNRSNGASGSRNGSPGQYGSNGKGSGSNSTLSGAGDSGASRSSSSGNGTSAGRTADQVLSDAARRLKQLGSRGQTLPPSDAASHSTPPRMPVDHDE